MRQFVILSTILFCMNVTAKAQTYLEHLQQPTQGKGKVTVNQSKAIDELVNGKAPIIQDDKTTPIKRTIATPTHPQESKTPEHKNVEHKNVEQAKKDSTKKAEAEKNAERENAITRESAQEKKSDSEKKEENETPMVDMRKKVMRGSYKVTGYRVQAYAGGNSRADRQKAEQIGNAIKMKYPDQPVYVHFYSPRWICRVGNFRSLGEANKMLQQVRAMGYKQACLVKGKITVQN